MKIKNFNAKKYMLFDDINMKFSENINIIFGENSTGKTALIQSLIHKKFIEITYFTVGFNYDILEYKYNNKICKLSLWDSQSLRFSILPTAFIKKANICIQ